VLDAAFSARKDSVDYFLHYPTSLKGPRTGIHDSGDKKQVFEPAFVKRLKEVGYRGPLTIEREISGAKQAEDIRASKAFLENLIG
jgi:hypothetical protein